MTETNKNILPLNKLNFTLQQQQKNTISGNLYTPPANTLSFCTKILNDMIHIFLNFSSNIHAIIT